MTANKTVQLQITSECEGQRLVQNFSAELYLKGRHVYIRYHEADPDMGRTVTTLKLATEPSAATYNELIRIIRHGDIQSEQSFAVQKHRAGFYQTPQGLMELATFTRSASLNLDETFLGTVVWSYDLFVSGELSGTFDLLVEISAGDSLERADGADLAGQ